MTKWIMAFFIATVCWMSKSQADVVSVTLDCASAGDAYAECDSGLAFTDAKLVREDVAGSCVYGSTWGTYGTSVWVNHGCSGRFKVSAENAPAPAPLPPPPVSMTVDCRFNSVNWQPFHKPTNHWIGRPGFGFADPNMCEQSVQMSRRHAVCNWVGNGFTPYDVRTNRELYFASYPDLQTCYDAIP